MKSFLEVSKLTASDAAQDDKFGYSVAVSGTTALVGAWIGLSADGAAYVFDLENCGQDCSEAVRPFPSGGTKLFGFSVAISGPTAVIGAPLEDSSTAGDVGAAYLFQTAANPDGPSLAAVDEVIGFNGSASSDLYGAGLTYDWDWGDDSTSNDAGATPTHVYGAAEIYDVCLTVTDAGGLSDVTCTIAVIYDPSAGFVSGGGWFDSPAGAYKDDPALSGKANFGFVSKYKRGAIAPSGDTHFEFETAAMEFNSTAYDWLVVSGTDAQFKGVGTINDALAPSGNPYKFKVWAGDDSPDTLHIKIWDEDAGANEIVYYDNGSQQAISHGNIIVHKK